MLIIVISGKRGLLASCLLILVSNRALHPVHALVCAWIFVYISRYRFLCINTTINEPPQTVRVSYFVEREFFYLALVVTSFLQSIYIGESPQANHVHY